jgi:alpha-galactosidase
VPVRGGSTYKRPAVEVVFADHVLDADLKFISGSIIEVDGRKTLQIIQQDRIYPLQITSYIRVLPKYDVLEKWMEVKNIGKTIAIKVGNLKSTSFFFHSLEILLVVYLILKIGLPFY